MTQGRKGNSSDHFQSPLSVWEGCFCPKSPFCRGFWLRDLQFCAHIFLSLSRNNSIPWIHFFLLPCCRFLLPGLGNWAFSSSNQRGKRYSRWRLTGFLFFSFFMWRKWDEQRKCNGLPACNPYPVASYISKAATSVPFKWPLLLYFVHIRYKLWWMLYRSYSVIWPQSRQVSWDIRSSDDLSLS